MRVLLLSKAMIVGAYQRKAEELAALPGVELTVAVPPSWREPRVGTTKLERQHTAGYQLAVLPIWLNGHFHTHFYPALGKLIDHVRPEVIHIDEESFNLATFQAMRLGVAAGARCCFYNYANIARRYPPPFGWFERYNFRHATAAMAANHEAAEIIRSHGFKGPLHILPQFGVDPEQFRPPAEPLPAKPFRLGYVGRLVPEKGVLDLIHAVAQLPELVELTIIGRGSQEAALQAEVERLGLNNRIRFQPMIPSAEVAAAMQQFHLLVLPSHTTSNWKEQFGRVLVEAMACGVPPVGSSSGEIPHVIGDGGVVFQEGNVADLTAKIHHLVINPTRRTELAERGRARVLAHYTQRAVAEQCHVIYQQMLTEPAANWS